jgi:hypothetical protein
MALISRSFHYPIDYHVQALPISLATTLGISVDFFSCSYLDVSVRRVRFAYLCIQYAMTYKAGFPHSEICGSKCVCSLPAAYRKLLRPSSPVIAKASTMCTYSLVPITLAPTDSRERHRKSRVQLVACLLIRYYYPKCLVSLLAQLAKRLKKLYFFQIVKERKNSDLEKIKPKSQPGTG